MILLNCILHLYISNVIIFEATAFILTPMRLGE